MTNEVQPAAAPTTTVTPPIVEFRHVSVHFGNTVALHDISFSVADIPNKGEFIALLGPSGCGKSTILNLITGFLTPTMGDVLVHGQPIDGPGRDRGMIFQQYSSFAHLTVFENVRFGLRLNRRELQIGRDEIDDRAMDLIRQVGLTGHEEKYPHQLSGGQQQRVAIARSFALEPRILLMDEPFSALDEPTRLEMQEILVRLWHRVHPTIFVVTHSIAEAVYLSERVWILSRAPGQIAYDITNAIPPTLEIPPLQAQEMPAFKSGVQAVTEAFRSVPDGRAMSGKT
jgi:NitT/TauT family transport system ATP-binding protein